MNIWRELLETGRLAPSPHNMQPWKLRARSHDEADLLVDPERLLHETDPAGRFVAVGLGCFVETLSVAAGASGYRIEATLTGAPLVRGATPVFASLRLTAFDGETLAPDLIRRRRTSRVRYDGRPVEAAALAELAAVAAAAGHRLTASSDPALVSFLLQLNQQALFFDMTDPSSRREVGSWLRFSAGAARRAGDGFAPECLGFRGWLLWSFFHARPLFELPGVRQAVRRLYLRSMSGTATVAWLHGPFATHVECFEAGRMLARLWLELTARGIWLHPFGSIVTNEAANRRLRERIGGDDAGELWLVMRVGYGPAPPASARLPVEALLVNG